MNRALKDADLNKDIAGESAADNRAIWNAIQNNHDERTKATLAAIIRGENKALTNCEAWAILNLALLCERG